MEEQEKDSMFAGKPELMRADELALAMGVSRQTVYRMEREHQIPSVRIGTRLFFPRDIVAASIKERVKHEQR